MEEYGTFSVYNSLGNQSSFIYIAPLISKILIYACQTLLSLQFFIESTKEMGTNYVFLQQAATNIMSVMCRHNSGLSLELGAFFYA